MIATHLITSSLNAVIFRFPESTSWLWESLVLTPVQKWQAAGRFNSGFMTEHWFIMTGVIVILILTALLFVVSYNRILQERKVTNQLFAKYADKRGLSQRERQILFCIVSKAGLKRSEAIFTMSRAFDRGAAEMIEENLARQQSVEQSKQLKTELSFLREKLGFKKRRHSSVGLMAKPKKLSTRQIHVGKKLQITRRKSGESATIESTVVKNSDIELTVKLAMPIESVRGETWRARYDFGVSVWEFDASVVSCNGSLLVFNHSDNIRFINRRRFLRVPVSKPAFIAHFPFSRTLGEEQSGAEQDSTDISGDTWGPPKFIPAVITELAGPGLRIKAGLEVKVGDRVLVTFRLDEEGRDSGFEKTGKTAASKIVEDIGRVRHIRTVENGFSIAVELAGLSDSDVNELIRATNAASLRSGQGIPGSAKVGEEERVLESIAAQGA